MEAEQAYLELKKKILDKNPQTDLTLLDKAFELARQNHKDQKRKSGEPFIIHPVSVASMLSDMDMDMPSIVAGMLHDVVEDTNVTIPELRDQFGDEIASLVDGVTKLKRIPTITKEELQAENLRKMFLSMASDIRVILIKLVDRLHNMRTLQYLNTDKQIVKARETLDIYTPLAHRLGMTQIKWELEDLCFKYLEPDDYDELERQINSKREERETYIKDLLEILSNKLSEAGIEASLDGRPKHLYSIHKKMIKQGKPLDQIYDLLAIRVIVNTVPECYQVLGIIHELFKPIPGRIKDYIAMPKPNMYQSLHTTLIGPGGKPFEAQIRTWDMHKAAEIGIAAHWKYKEGLKESKEKDLESKLEWVRNLLDNSKEIDDDSEFAETFKMDLFTDEVFVFTPTGEVKVLPKGSTPIDFAYSIHSAVGNRMTGAKVNGEIKPLNYKLQTGDFCEIITTSALGKGPSRDWLNIVKSAEAKSKIRQWFKKEKRDENIETGKIEVEKEIKRLGLSNTDLMRDEWIEPILDKYSFRSMDDLYNVIGFGEISPIKFVGWLNQEFQKTSEGKERAQAEAKAEMTQNQVDSEHFKGHAENGILVKGINNCLVKLARCCNPVPGDSIIGFVTRGRGVSVHRTDCKNLASMNEEGAGRFIDVRWADKIQQSYQAEFTVKAVDSDGILLQVANVIGECKVSLRSVNAKTTRDNYGLISIVVEINERKELDNLIKKISQLKNVVEITRGAK